MLKLEIGDWIKIKDEEDYFNILSLNYDSGFARVKTMTGHKWHVAIRTIKNKCTNEEIYGFEPTTADEYNLPICSNDLNIKNKEI